MKDGDGNLIASDGLLWAPIAVRFERDILRGRYAWTLHIAWGLKRDPKPGEFVYRRRWEASFVVHPH